MKDVKGLVLCGGPGKRLRPLTYYFQKAMIPIGSKQKPLLEYIVRLLGLHGVSQLVFLADYKAEQIMNYFDDGSRFGVEITYIGDDPKCKGTAGSILNAYRKNAIQTSDTLLVYYGDILTNMRLTDLIAYHKEKEADATVALSSGFTVRVGVANMKDDGEMLGFAEKPRLEKPVSIGIVALEAKTLDIMENLKGKMGDLDLMGDVIPHLIRNGRSVYGYVSDAFWYDVGSVEDYEKLSPELVEENFSYLFQQQTG